MRHNTYIFYRLLERLFHNYKGRMSTPLTPPPGYGVSDMNRPSGSRVHVTPYDPTTVSVYDDYVLSLLTAPLLDPY